MMLAGLSRPGFGNEKCFSRKPVLQTGNLTNASIYSVPRLGYTKQTLISSNMGSGESSCLEPDLYRLIDRMASGT